MSKGKHPFDQNQETNGTYGAQFADSIRNNRIRFDQDSFSEDAQDFISLALTKNPTERPSADELLNHPWLAQENTGIEEVSALYGNPGDFGNTAVSGRLSESQ